MNRLLRAIRAKCPDCWGHGGYFYHGHWTRCGTCNGSGNA